MLPLVVNSTDRHHHQLDKTIHSDQSCSCCSFQSTSLRTTGLHWLRASRTCILRPGGVRVRISDFNADCLSHPERFAPFLFQARKKNFPTQAGSILFLATCFAHNNKAINYYSNNSGGSLNVEGMAERWIGVFLYCQPVLLQMALAKLLRRLKQSSSSQCATR